MCPRRVFPPVEYCRGTRPSQAKPAAAVELMGITDTGDDRRGTQGPTPQSSWTRWRARGADEVLEFALVVEAMSVERSHMCEQNRGERRPSRQMFQSSGSRRRLQVRAAGNVTESASRPRCGSGGGARLEKALAHARSARHLLFSRLDGQKAHVGAGDGLEIASASSPSSCRSCGTGRQTSGRSAAGDARAPGLARPLCAPEHASIPIRDPGRRQ